MEGLLHWDFSLGLAVEAQVRSLFSSMVHFSLHDSTKELYLVVSFSSASFPLSEESMGIFSLQCCIGGSPSGFHDKHLVGSQFWFSVTSNRVGQFIYVLKDRIWPDFICHFNLYRHVAWNYSLKHFNWHPDQEFNEIVARSPMPIKSNLNFLRHGNGLEPTSSLEVGKFGFSSHATDVLTQRPIVDSPTMGSNSNGSITSNSDSLGLIFSFSPCVVKNHSIP